MNFNRKIDLFIKLYLVEENLYITNSSFSLGKKYRDVPYFAIHGKISKKRDKKHVIGIKNSKIICVDKTKIKDGYIKV